MKKRSLLLTVLSALALSLSACGTSAGPLGGEQETPYQTITAAEAKKMMDKGGVTIVDVRTGKEFEEKHVRDAVNIPVETLTGSRPEALPDTGATLLVYCRSGARSARASKALAEMGYENVYNFGGIIDWPYETE